jgi:hypothetical protein
MAGLSRLYPIGYQRDWDRATGRFVSRLTYPEIAAHGADHSWSMVPTGATYEEARLTPLVGFRRRSPRIMHNSRPSATTFS